MLQKGLWCACKIALGLSVGLIVVGLGFSRACWGDDPLRLVFLGDNGHHQPARRAAELLPGLRERGVEVRYSDDMNAVLTPEKLGQLDGLIVYANIDQLGDQQATALLEFVEKGGGFIPLHCASYCFRNQPEIVALIGAQFQRHGVGVFSVQPSKSASQHPLMQGYSSFESWDETYVHTLHNDKNRTVLEYRQEGDNLEPWTWVRTHGKGRVFYTAWGHDARTFQNDGFHNLVERGIRWACGDDPSVVPDFDGVKPEPLADLAMTELSKDVTPFDYIDVGPKIPNYVDSAQWGKQEKPRNLMQKPLSPEESIKHYSVPEGFRLELFVSEPDLGGKPICMDWDERGRLWVAETYDYPNEMQREGEGRDRIRICEDTNGDGKADKFTVFAEKLSIPTSFAFSHGGLIVHQAPHTLFFKDTDGDDVADLRKVLFTGWSTGDTHAGPSNLNYGHDNWFYGMVGYAGFDGEIAGEKRSFRTGFYRFLVQQVGGEVSVTDFEFLRNTNNNSWGVGLSEEGLLFGSTANRNPSEFMPVANRYYEKVRGWTSSVLNGIADTHRFAAITNKVRQVDHHGGYTAAAGHALYTARRYPQAYWNRTAFVAGPTGHLVGTFALSRDGAGFRSTSPANLIASDDEWAAPIMAEVGPDGNVWVLDWYNYIVQHNPTPVGFKNGRGNAYVTDLRDKKYGRIYRVVYGDDRDPISLERATAKQLVETLKHPNMLWRRHAQRLLIERNDESVAEALVALVMNQEVDEIGLNVGAIHALRTLHWLGQLKGNAGLALLHQCLKHPSPGVVRTAVEVLPRSQSGRELLLVANTIGSKDAQVRLATLLALSDMPRSNDCAKLALASLQSSKNRSDRWLVDAATSVAAKNSGDFLVLVSGLEVSGEAVFNAIAVVSEHMARSADRDAISTVLPVLAGATPEIRSAVIAGWTRGWPKDTPANLTREADDQLLGVFETLDAGGKGQLIRLAAAFGSAKLAENAKMISASLMKIASDEEMEGQARVDAATELIGLMSVDGAVVDKLLGSISGRTDQNTAVGLVTALQQSRATSVGVSIIDSVPRMTPVTRKAAIRVMLARPESTQALLVALDDGDLDRTDLALDQQQALLAHPRKEIREQAKRVFAGSGGVPSPDRVAVLNSLMRVTKQKGDVVRGKQVYVKNCANCHMHRGEGNQVGPDLTGMAVHPKDELLTHILDPSRSVEGNYRSYSVLTTDGLVINGLLASETQTAIEIFDAQGKKLIVLREEIDQLVASKKSVMPEGFEKQIDEQGFADLLDFLTDRGAYLPLPLDKSATAISTKGLFHEGDNGPDRIIFEDWSPKMVAGVPFNLIDPQGKSVPNIVLLNGPRGTVPPSMPKSVKVPCNAPLKSLHLLSGVSGWGFPAHGDKSVSMIVRLHLEDGSTEDHPLLNGVHFADYIRRVDVKGSEFAMNLRGQQMRYLQVKMQTDQLVESIELVKGDDPTAPIVVAITAEPLSNGAAH